MRWLKISREKVSQKVLWFGTSQPYRLYIYILNVNNNDSHYITFYLFEAIISYVPGTTPSSHLSPAPIKYIYSFFLRMTENGALFNLEEWVTQYERHTHTLQSDTSATSSPSFTLVSETSSRSIMNNTCLNRHGRHSGSFAFDSVESSLRDSNAENDQGMWALEPLNYLSSNNILELNDTLNLSTSQFITWTLIRRSWILFTTLVTFALALVLACKRLPAINSDLSFS